MSHGTSAVRLPAYVVGSAKYSILLGLPRLLGILRLSSTSADRQVVVEVDRGAHASFYVAYRIWHGQFRRTHLPVGTSGRFTWDEGATNFGNVDCVTRGASMTVDEYGVFTRYPKPGWDLETVTYRLVGLNFVREHFTDGTATDQQLKKVQSEFAEKPFGHCAGTHTP